MDPNSAIYNIQLPTHFVLSTMLEWFIKGRSFYWDKEPDDVMTEIYLDGWDGTPLPYIKFGRAVELLRTARTSKMPGHANAGMSWMIQQWREEAKKRLKEKELHDCV